MRKINYIVFHCTATEKTAKVESILRYWKERRGWKNPGYHFIIEASGEVTQLHPIDKASNGVKGHNHESINISYIGGKDIDDRTDAQIVAQKAILKTLLASFPDAEVMGHRDFEGVSKSCPRFDAKDLLK